MVKYSLCTRGIKGVSIIYGYRRVTFYERRKDRMFDRAQQIELALLGGDQTCAEKGAPSFRAFQRLIFYKFSFLARGVCLRS